MFVSIGRVAVWVLHNCIQKYLTKYFSSFKLTIHKDKGVLEQDNTALRRFLLMSDQVNKGLTNIKTMQWGILLRGSWHDLVASFFVCRAFVVTRGRFFCLIVYNKSKEPSP